MIGSCTSQGTDAQWWASICGPGDLQEIGFGDVARARGEREASVGLDHRQRGSCELSITSENHAKSYTAAKWTKLAACFVALKLR